MTRHSEDITVNRPITYQEYMVLGCVATSVGIEWEWPSSERYSHCHENYPIPYMYRWRDIRGITSIKIGWRSEITQRSVSYEEFIEIIKSCKE